MVLNKERVKSQKRQREALLWRFSKCNTLGAIPFLLMIPVDFLSRSFLVSSLFLYKICAVVSMTNLLHDKSLSRNFTKSQRILYITKYIECIIHYIQLVTNGLKQNSILSFLIKRVFLAQLKTAQANSKHGNCFRWRI